jgi:hypothetical protein
MSDVGGKAYQNPVVKERECLCQKDVRLILFTKMEKPSSQVSRKVGHLFGRVNSLFY